MRLPKVGEKCEAYFSGDTSPEWWGMIIEGVSASGEVTVQFDNGEVREYSWEDLIRDTEFRFDDSLEQPPEDIELGVYRPDLNTRKLGKVQMELVDTGFPNALYAISEVMTWAADNKGYKPNDWKNLPDSFMAFTGAAGRHRVKRLKGEELDDESGLLHLSHEAFNILALLETTLLGKSNESC